MSQQTAYLQQQCLNQILTATSSTSANGYGSTIYCWRIAKQSSLINHTSNVALVATSVLSCMHALIESWQPQSGFLQPWVWMCTELFICAGQRCCVCEAICRVHHRELGAERASCAHAQARATLPAHLPCQVSVLLYSSTSIWCPCCAAHGGVLHIAGPALHMIASSTPCISQPPLPPVFPLWLKRPNDRCSVEGYLQAGCCLHTCLSGSVLW